MAGAASSAGRLRRAIGEFLQESGEDPKYRSLAGELRQLDQKLSGAGSKAPELTPGQKAAGVEKGSPEGGRDDTGSPGRRAASTAGAGDMSAKESALRMVGAESSAKGPSNLAPFDRRQRMKQKATARKGS